MTENKGTEMTCAKCGYPWEYTGKRKTASCPSCKATNKVPQ